VFAPEALGQRKAHFGKEPNKCVLESFAFSSHRHRIR